MSDLNDECVKCWMIHQSNGIGLGGDHKCMHEWKSELEKEKDE